MKANRSARRAWLAALATVGVAGGVYAAEQAAAPSGDLDRTITEQRIGDGRAAKPISEHQLQPFTPDQMLKLGAQYHLEIKTAAEHVEALRVQAYRSRDIIRMTCVDDKLTQIGVLQKAVEPRSLALARETEMLPMRQHFSLVRQARERANEIVADAENCMGEDIGSVPTSKIQGEDGPNVNIIDDPTRAPTPAREVDRPPEASPYR